MRTDAFKVLIIEDDRDTRDGLHEVLEMHGFSSVCVDHGERGLELLRSEYFDLALLDWKLPGMGGAEVLTHREQDDAAGRTPVLVLTASGIGEVDLSPFSNVSLLHKPFKVDELLRRMIQARAKRHSG